MNCCTHRCLLSPQAPWCSRCRSRANRQRWGYSGCSLVAALLIIRASTLVATHVAWVVSHVFPSRDAFPLATLVKSLLVGASVLAGVRQPAHAAHRGRFLWARGWGAWAFSLPSPPLSQPFSRDGLRVVLLALRARVQPLAWCSA